jgi:hypothetical protein
MVVREVVSSADGVPVHRARRRQLLPVTLEDMAMADRRSDKASSPS